ncbi:hypothetical protein LUQ84_001245 [Hamiltosporidium tvaerminnensis]|nr:hypothetical protein LUQ84_001245 [Hamiltosporidium tvaerminnensis]
MTTYKIHIFIENFVFQIRRNICFKDICTYLGFPLNLESVDMVAELERPSLIQDVETKGILKPKTCVEKENSHIYNEANDIPKKNYNAILKNQKQIQKTVKIEEITINNNEIVDKEKKFSSGPNEKISTVPLLTVHDLNSSNVNTLKKIQAARNRGDITSMSTSEILAFNIVDGIFDGVSFLDE